MLMLMSRGLHTGLQATLARIRLTHFWNFPLQVLDLTHFHKWTNDKLLSIPNRSIIMFTSHMATNEPSSRKWIPFHQDLIGHAICLSQRVMSLMKRTNQRKRSLSCGGETQLSAWKNWWETPHSKMLCIMHWKECTMMGMGSWGCTMRCGQATGGGTCRWVLKWIHFWGWQTEVKKRNFHQDVPLYLSFLLLIRHICLISVAISLLGLST